jgi:Uma2 family endonuclease
LRVDKPLIAPADWVSGPEQGSWTYADYAVFTGDERCYEIMNGFLYMTPVPSWSHQEVVLEIATHLRSYIQPRKLGGVFVAPVDVELAPNMVFQPDVVVLLKAGRDKLRSNHIVGAPDLVIEVVSPDSAVYDRHDKNVAYAQAGVPEYWIVDPSSRTVELLALEGEKYRVAGVFQGKAVLPSKVLPGFNVAVEKFFESVWS